MPELMDEYQDAENDYRYYYVNCYRLRAADVSA